MKFLQKIKSFSLLMFFCCSSVINSSNELINKNQYIGENYNDDSNVIIQSESPEAPVEQNLKSTEQVANPTESLITTELRPEAIVLQTPTVEEEIISVVEKPEDVVQKISVQETPIKDIPMQDDVIQETLIQETPAQDILISETITEENQVMPEEETKESNLIEEQTPVIQEKMITIAEQQKIPLEKNILEVQKIKSSEEQPHSSYYILDLAQTGLEHLKNAATRMINFVYDFFLKQDTSTQKITI